MADLDLIPTDPCAVEKELRRVQALMQLEQKEDLPDWTLEGDFDAGAYKSMLAASA